MHKTRKEQSAWAHLQRHPPLNQWAPYPHPMEPYPRPSNSICPFAPGPRTHGPWPMADGPQATSPLGYRRMQWGCRPRAMGPLAMAHDQKPV